MEQPLTECIVQKIVFCFINIANAGGQGKDTLLGQHIKIIDLLARNPLALQDLEYCMHSVWPYIVTLPWWGGIGHISVQHHDNTTAS
jgi:hypothetical protein